MSHSSSSSSDAEVKTSTPKAAAATSTVQKSATTDKINTPPSSPKLPNKTNSSAWRILSDNLQAEAFTGDVERLAALLGVG
mmetsp:Transcript_5086/g.7785  ORF Transcript_5086/g.7785 Transcript_5086/m.7785 type:complete len:81 (+) Transcript_5086:689-931(+)